MKHQRLKFLLSCILVVSLVLLGAGCFSNNQNNTSIPNPNGTEAAKPLQKVTDAAPPTSLMTIHNAAKSMLDDLSKGNWKKANAKLRLIQNAWTDYQPELKKFNVDKRLINAFDSTIDNLQTQLNDRRNYGARLAANNITRLTPGFFDLYANRVPTDIKRIEYIGRQLKLDLEGDKWGEAIKNVNVLNALWKELQPRANEVSPATAQKIDKTVASLNDAIKDKMHNDKQRTIVNREANRLLAQVNALANSFNK